MGRGRAFIPFGLLNHQIEIWKVAPGVLMLAMPQQISHRPANESQSALGQNPPKAGEQQRQTGQSVHDRGSVGHAQARESHRP
jgi:hypothetical protein